MTTQHKGKVVLIGYTPALFSPLGFESELLARAGASWEVHQCFTAEEVLKAARDADVVAVQAVRPLLTREVLAQLPRCRCTIRAGAGYDSIDYKSATEFGIMVCNCPTYCTDDVADNAMALLMGAVRNIPRLDAAMKQGRWSPDLAVPTRRVKGATLGIIGLGRIGTTFARRVSGWEMTLLAYDPYVGQDHADKVGVRMVGLNELLERSDFISVHCLLTDETRHMLSWDQFGRMKQGAIVVNTARGPIIHTEALTKALEEKRLWGVGLDVSEPEPLPLDSPLRKMDNAILTPHVSANSPEARHDLYVQICEISGDVVQGRIPRFVVNPEVLTHLRKVE